jgi:Icc-related predicted phosphoesterase
VCLWLRHAIRGAVVGAVDDDHGEDAVPAGFVEPIPRSSLGKHPWIQRTEERRIEGSAENERFSRPDHDDAGMLVLGDAHADTPTKRRRLLAAYDAYDACDAEKALQLGDLLYYDLPTPTWFIAGNNEDFDVIDALRAGRSPDGVANAHLLASTVVELEGLRVAGLSGNHAPTQFEKSRDDLVGDRRRHFVREDVERATQLEDVDVFLAHEAPHGLDVTEDYDVGCTHIDTVLDALEPDLCLVGHHHEHVTGTYGDTRVVSLAPAWTHYYTLDTDTLHLERHETPHP